jgi:hypothetical protein
MSWIDRFFDDAADVHLDALECRSKAKLESIRTVVKINAGYMGTICPVVHNGSSP